MVDNFKKFEDIHAGVTAGTIRSAADDPARNTNVITALEGELSRDDRAVADAIEGDIEAGTRTNPQEAARVANNLARKGQYAVGLMNKFATAVDTFDTGVDELNGRLSTTTSQRYNTARHTHDSLPDADAGDPPDYNAIKAQVKAELQGEYDALLRAVDEEATSVASMFRNYSDENARRLFTQGYIPLGVAGLWGGAITLTSDEKRQAYVNAIQNGSLPDFSTMTRDEVKQYIDEHPEVSAGVTDLMTVPNLPPALTELVNAQAEVDADLLNSVIDDDPSGETLERIDEATARLAAVNAAIADGHKMTAAQGDYIETWTNTVGADNLTKLPQVVEDSVRETVPGNFLPPQVDDIVQRHLAPVANAILNYSNPDVHRDDAGIDRAGYYGGSTFTPADGRITLSEMPQAIQDIMGTRLGQEGDRGARYGTDLDTDHGVLGSTFGSIDGYGRLSGWADLLSNADTDVEPGDDFSQDLARQAITAKQDLNAIIETGDTFWDQNNHSNLSQEVLFEGGEYDTRLNLFDYDDGPMSQLLSVAARNEDGASHVLLDETNRQAVLSMNWDDDTGAVDLIHSATDRDPAGGGGTELQARAAVAIIQDVGENQAGYLGGRYDSDHDGDIDKNDSTSNAHMVEGVSDAVVDVGISWMDQLGAGTRSDQEDGAHGAAFTLNPETESKYLRFVSGTGDEDAVRFHAAANWDSQRQITEAMRSGDDAAVKAALDRAGRLEGRIVGADMEHQIDLAADSDADANQKADEQYSAKQRQMAAFRMVADLGTSVIPGLSAAENASGLAKAGTEIFNAASGEVQSGFLDQLFDAGSPPEDSHARETSVTNEWQSAIANDAQSYQRQMAVQAALDAGVLHESDLPSGSYSTHDGRPVLSSDASADALSQPYFSLGLDEGTYESGWQGGFDGRERDRLWAGEMSNAERARERLYGDNYQYWDEYGFDAADREIRDHERYQDMPQTNQYDVIQENPYDDDHEKIGTR